jgi:hypothetical protein
MNVKIGTEAAPFPEKKHINGIFVAVCLSVRESCCTPCTPFLSPLNFVADSTALIKNKIKFSSFIFKFKWSSCKVIYEEGLSNI